MATQTSERPRYVPGGGEAWRAPWQGYAALRDHDPVHHVVPESAPELDYYVLSRHADVMAAAVDAASFSSAEGLTVHYDELERIGLADNPPMVMQDPPDHTTFRRLVSRGFTPRAVVSVEPAVRAFVRERLERHRRPRRGRHRGRGVQAAAEHGRRPLPRRPGGGPRPLRRLDRRDRGGGRGRRRDRSAGRDRRDARLLLRAGRAASARARRRHGLAPGRGRCRGRRPRPALDPGLRVHDGHRRQRHDHRHARRRRPAAHRAPRPAPRARRRPRPRSAPRSRSCCGSPRRSRGWPAPPPATSRCTT